MHHFSDYIICYLIIVHCFSVNPAEAAVPLWQQAIGASYRDRLPDKPEHASAERELADHAPRQHGRPDADKRAGPTSQQTQ